MSQSTIMCIGQYHMKKHELSIWSFPHSVY